MGRLNLWIGFTVLCLNQVKCNDDMALIFNKIERLDENVMDMRGDMFRIEEDMMNNIKIAKKSLKSELKQHIKEQVRNAIAEILKGESIEEMVRSQIVSEVRKLKQGHHQMKRQLHHLMKSLRDVQEDREMYKEALLKAERNASEMMTCSKYVVDSKVLQRDLEKCNDHLTEKKTEWFKEKGELNATCKLQLENITMASAVKQGEKGITDTYDSTVTTVVTTSSTTTTIPEEERSRIIVAPYYSGTQHQFRQMNIHSNSLSSYPYLSLKKVFSLVYVSKLRKLLIGLHNPNKIVSSNLDSYGVRTMREGVLSYGMAVDEDREIVFIGTRSPRKSISRMTTKGKQFITISSLSNYSLPYAIAVNPKEEKIYVCDGSKVFMMTYDGRNVQTLATGNYMYSVAFDKTGDILYYNNHKDLMKISLSQNVTANVTKLSDKIPWNVIYHRNKVYFTVHGSPIGVVDVGNNIMSYTLQSVSFKGSSRNIICLVP